MLFALPADPLGLLPWLLVQGGTLAVAAVVLVTMPQHPRALWLAVGTLGSVNELTLWALRAELAADAAGVAIALCNLVQQLLYLTSALAASRILGLFADGRVHACYEAVTLRLTWIVLLVPLALLVCSPVVPLLRRAARALPGRGRARVSAGPGQRHLARALTPRLSTGAPAGAGSGAAPC